MTLLALSACTSPKDDSSADSGTVDSGDSGTVDSADTGDSGDSDSGGETGDSGGNGGETGDSGGNGGNGGDTGACLVSGPTATGSREIDTVLTVTWTTSGAGESVVEWGYTRSYGYQTAEATDSTTRHEVVVAGPAPGETIHWRVRSTVDGTPCVSDDQTTTIGTDRSPLTTLTLNTSTSGFTPGFRVVPLAGGTPGVAIVDDEGRQVWWHAPDAGLSAVQSWLSADGTHVMYMVEDSDRSDDIGGLVTVSLDQTDVQFYPLHYCHHSFTPLADGRIAYLATDPENYHGDIVAGDDVMIANADGSDAHSIFNTWDNWVPDMNRVQTEGGHYYPNWLDWTHGNSLNQRADGTLLVSFHGIDTVINLSLDGTLNWTMGGQDPGADSDFTYSGSATDLFSHQHQPVDVGGNLLIFNNGTGARGTYSEAVEYEIDESRHTFTQTWKFDWDGSQMVQLEGDVQRMPNGNTLIDWGSNGFLTEVTPGGDIVWQISSGGNILGFLQQYPMIGGPT